MPVVVFLHANHPVAIRWARPIAHDRSMSTPRYPSRGSALLRLGRRNEPGRIYLVTFATFSRKPLFADWLVALETVRSMRSPQIWRGSSLLCWVLMPDHWHGLVGLGDMDALSALVNRLKGTSARAINLQRGQHEPVWADGFHDHALRRDEDLVAVARYIVGNPVRAGIVERVGRYPFWDAVWLDRSNEQRSG